MNSDPNMKLLLNTERVKRDCMKYVIPLPCDAADAVLRDEDGLREGE